MKYGNKLSIFAIMLWLVLLSATIALLAASKKSKATINVSEPTHATEEKKELIFDPAMVATTEICTSESQIEAATETPAIQVEPQITTKSCPSESLIFTESTGTSFVSEETEVTEVYSVAIEETDTLASRSASYIGSQLEFNDEDVRMLAALLEHESINLAGDEKIYPLWCVLNRMDDATGRFPNTVYGVLTQPGQFMSYYGTPKESTKELVKDELRRYLAWQIGEAERPMPENLVFYVGKGDYNLFRTEYAGGSYWAKGKWIWN